MLRGPSTRKQLNGPYRRRLIPTLPTFFLSATLAEKNADENDTGEHKVPLDDSAFLLLAELDVIPDEFSQGLRAGIDTQAIGCGRSCYENPSQLAMTCPDRGS